MKYRPPNAAVPRSIAPPNEAFELTLTGFPARGSPGGRRGHLSVGWFRPLLMNVLRMEGICTGFWAVRLLTAEAMAELHLRTMNIPAPTDVLTFDYSGGEGMDRHIELDTAVCLDVARREAVRRGHSVGHELLLYMVHSLLHVRGYNDLTAHEARRMHRREDEILTQMLTVPVYRARKGAGRRRNKVASGGRAG